MARKVCSNCGYKNKSTAMICSNCGNMLSDPQPVFQSPAEVQPKQDYYQQEKQETNEQYSNRSSTEANGATLNVSSRKGVYRYIPQMISGVVLAAFIGLEYWGQLPSYSFFGFLMIIVFLPTLMRGMGTGIKFSPSGFKVENSGSEGTISYNEIENAVVGTQLQGFSSVKISFRNNSSPVTMNFDSTGTFRMFLMQLSRRRIPITREGQESNTAQESAESS